MTDITATMKLNEAARMVEREFQDARLLAVAHTPQEAARVALDFMNWDLEADGADWRLTLTPAR